MHQLCECECCLHCMQGLTCAGVLLLHLLLLLLKKGFLQQRKAKDSLLTAHVDIRGSLLSSWVAEMFQTDTKTHRHTDAQAHILLIRGMVQNRMKCADLPRHIKGQWE